MTRLVGASIVGIAAAIVLTSAMIVAKSGPSPDPQGGPADTGVAAAPTGPIRAPAPTTAAGPAAPRLVLRPAFIDMGPLRRQSTHAVSTEVRNKGEAELIIERTEIACRCFTASLNNRRLRPGEAATLTVNVKTLSHRGELAERVGLVSNDPAGVKAVDLRFEVLDDLQAEPARLYLGCVRPGAAAVGHLRIKTNTDAETQVLYAACISSSPGRQVSALKGPQLAGEDDGELVGSVVRATVGRNSPAEVEVRFKAPTAPGTCRRTLAVTTADASNPIVRVPVILSVSPVAAISPDRVDFGRFARGQTPARSLEITLAQGSRIASVTARPEVLEATVSEPRPSGQGHLVEVQLKTRPDAPYGPFRGELPLRIEGGEDSTLIVPFAGYVHE